MIFKPIFSYKDNSPSEILKDYIECYWEFQIETSKKKCFNIIPDGLFDLILTIKDNQIISCNLTGIWDKPIEISYSSACKHIGIRFKPTAIKSFFKQSISEFLNSSTAFDPKTLKINKDVFLDHTGSPESYIAYLNNIFEKLLADAKIDNRLITLYNYINNTKGNTSVDELSYKFGLSKRQVHRVISYDLGISPKPYIQIIRSKKLLEQINSSNLYPENSFFDQSHLIRNVKRFTGVSPKRFAANKNVRFIQF